MSEDNFNNYEYGKYRRKSSHGRSRRKKRKNAALIIICAGLLFTAFFLCAAILRFNYIRRNKPPVNAQNTAELIETDLDRYLIESESQTDSEASEASTEGNEITGLKTERSDSEDISEEQKEIEAKEEQDALNKLLDEGWLKINQADNEKISLTFAGDILFDDRYSVMADLVKRTGADHPDISSAFDNELLEDMRSADIFMLNNEFPYSDRGTPLENKEFTFRAKPQYASLLKELGVDVVSLANNHVNDYGTESLLDTLSTLRDIGMPYAGAGQDIDEASAAVRFTNGKAKIAVLSATQIERMSDPDTKGADEENPGTFRCFPDIDRLLKNIQTLKEEGCFVIVYIHWGTESKENIDDWQTKQSRQIAESGADLIIGDHPHILQKMDIIGRTPVIYSLGNYWFNSKAIDTGLLNVVLDNEASEIKEINFIPAVQSGLKTRKASGEDAARIINHMNEISTNIGFDADGHATMIFQD